MENGDSTQSSILPIDSKRKASEKNDKVHDSSEDIDDLPRRDCDECTEGVAIYVCPGCRIRTCSLPCCRRHKERTGCNGKRDRTAFLPIGRMTDGTLRSDYFFLEEVLRQLPTKLAKNEKQGKQGRDKRPKLNHPGNGENATNVPNYSFKERRLIDQAKLRGVTLQLMPTFMARHKSNSTHFQPKNNTIIWKVDIVGPGDKTVSCRISENEESIVEHIVKACGLQTTAEKDLGDHCLFIQRLPGAANKRRYKKISPNESLRKQLDGMTVIEYPTIYCASLSDHGNFPIGSQAIEEVRAFVAPPPAALTHGTNMVQPSPDDFSSSPFMPRTKT